MALLISPFPPPPHSTHPFFNSIYSCWVTNLIGVQGGSGGSKDMRLGGKKRTLTSSVKKHAIWRKWRQWWPVTQTGVGQSKETERSMYMCVCQSELSEWLMPRLALKCKVTDVIRVPAGAVRLGVVLNEMLHCFRINFSNHVLKRLVNARFSTFISYFSRLGMRYPKWK